MEDFRPYPRRSIALLDRPGGGRHAGIARLAESHSAALAGEHGDVV